MKKVYIYDKQTGKMIERRPQNELPNFHIQQGESGINLGEGAVLDVCSGLLTDALAVRLPKSELPHTAAEHQLTERQHKENLARVFELADQHAEAMDRRDCVRVQEKIEALRQQYLEE